MVPKPEVEKPHHDKIFAPNFLVTIEMMQDIQVCLSRPVKQNNPSNRDNKPALGTMIDYDVKNMKWKGCPKSG